MSESLRQLVLKGASTYTPGPPPPWRDFRKNHGDHPILADRKAIPALSAKEIQLAEAYVAGSAKTEIGGQSAAAELQLIKAALDLRRPILIVGPPGIGKSTLAHVAAHSLGLGKVLKWPVTSSSTLQDGLYTYDAVARLQYFSLISSMLQSQGDLRQRGETLLSKGKPQDEGRFFRLGPLGTALLPARLPRVLLIDELDKGDIDLPSDLLHVLEEGTFEIAELARLPREAGYDDIPVRPFDSRDETGTVTIRRGKVDCYEFPLIFMTSNGERDFSRAFKRRCLRWKMQFPDDKQLADIVKSHFRQHRGAFSERDVKHAVDQFLASQRNQKAHSVDQLLNMFFLEHVSDYTGDSLLSLQDLNESDQMSA